MANRKQNNNSNNSSARTSHASQATSSARSEHPGQHAGQSGQKKSAERHGAGSGEGRTMGPKARGKGQGRSAGRGARNGSHAPSNRRQGGGAPGASGLSSYVAGLRQTGSQVAEGFASTVETIRDNPVPAMLIGAGAAGLAWLAYEGARRQYPQAIYEKSKEALGSAAGTVGEGLSGAAHAVGGRLAQGAEALRETFQGSFEHSVGATRDRVSQLGSRLGVYAQTGVSRTGEVLRDGASAVGEGVQHGYEYSRDAMADLWENHPLAVGMGLLALGVAAGMLLPATGLERRLMGERSQGLRDRAKTAGRELVSQGKELAEKVVSTGASAAAAEAERVGLTPERLTRKVKRVAGRVRKAVAEAAGD